MHGKKRGDLCFPGVWKVFFLDFVVEEKIIVDESLKYATLFW